MKGFIDFIREGNLVALAVAFVIGAAFVGIGGILHDERHLASSAAIFGTQTSMRTFLHR